MPSESERGAQQRAVAELREVGDRLGRIPAARVNAVAQQLGVGCSTVWRWIANGVPGPRERGGYRLSERAMVLYFVHCGSVAAVYRALRREGQPVPDLRTMQRAFQRELTPAERAFAKEGEEGRRRLSLYRRVESSQRNELWEADHVELPVLTVPKRGSKPAKVWLTVFLDTFSRAIMGWAISQYPTQSEVLAALEASVLEFPERGPFSGIPGALRWDNGLDWVSDSVSQAAVRLGCLVAGTTEYSPHQKGKVERFFGTLEREVISGLPQYTNGPKRANGALYGARDSALSLELLIEEVEGYINHYNLERPHKGLDGQTPLQRWQGDSTPLNLPSRESLHWMLLPRESRKVHKDGIHFNRVIFFASELNGMVGETVEVRFMPHDQREIEIWREGEFVALAKPQNALTAEETERYLQQKREDAKRMNRLRRKASREARMRSAPVTGSGGEHQDIVRIDRERAQQESATRVDVDVKSQARSELLDLDGLDEPVDDA